MRISISLILPISLVTVVAGIIMLFSSQNVRGQNSDGYKVTGIHKAIVSEDEWLNVNRALEADDLKGRIILLDFWTYCCINCIHVIPDLQYLEKKFGEKITVIGVHSAKFRNEQDKENIKSAVLRYDIEHPVVNDKNFVVWGKFGARAWPTLVLINPDGTIEETYSGEGHREQLEKDITELLEEYKGRVNVSPLPIVLEKSKAPKTTLHFPGKIEYTDNFDGNEALFISDSGHHRILVTSIDGVVYKQIGSGKEGYRNGSFAEAQFHKPQGLLYKDNILYVADTGNHTVRKIDFNSEAVETIAGTGKQGHVRTAFNESALQTRLSSPWDLEFYPNDNTITIAMAGTHQLWTLDLNEGTVSVLAGNGRESIDDGAYPFNSLSQPSGLSKFGDKLYFADSETSSLRELHDNTITTLIGHGLFEFGYQEGKRDKALMQHAIGVYAAEDGIYIADTYNHAIRKYNPITKNLENLSGNGERGNVQSSLNKSRYNEPNDVYKTDNKLYVADTNNHAIRVMDLSDNKVSTLNIIPESKTEEEMQVYAEDLPNLKHLADSEIRAGNKSTLEINLPDGWKVNEAAPSWISIFEMNGTNHDFIKNFEQNDLQNQIITLPELEGKKDYKLQGTIYYCEDKPNSICFIKSFDKLINADVKTSTNKIEVKIKLDF